MVSRNPGRYLAPIALTAVIVAIVLVVQGGLGTTNHHAPAPRAAQHAAASRHTTPAKTSYVIQAGDSLSVISVKTGIPVPTLESLNPGVSPNALQTGQRLRLRH
jgi:LysM repeat protein